MLKFWVRSIRRFWNTSYVSSLSRIHTHISSPNLKFNMWTYGSLYIALDPSIPVFSLILRIHTYVSSMNLKLNVWTIISRLCPSLYSFTVSVPNSHSNLIISLVTHFLTHTHTGIHRILALSLSLTTHSYQFIHWHNNRRTVWEAWIRRRWRVNRFMIWLKVLASRRTHRFWVKSILRFWNT